MPNDVLKKQDCVAVVEVHVLACSNPALDHVSKVSAPLEKFPEHKKFSHPKIFCSPQVKAQARSHAPRTTARHWEGTAGRPAGRIGRESSEPGAAWSVLKGGRVDDYVVIHMPADLKTAAGAMRQTALWHNRAAPPAPELVSQTFRFHPIRPRSKQSFSTGAYFC